MKQYRSQKLMSTCDDDNYEKCKEEERKRKREWRKRKKVNITSCQSVGAEASQDAEYARRMKQNQKERQCRYREKNKKSLI